MAKEVEEQKTNEEIPSNLQDKNIETKMTDLKTIIQNRLVALEDLATLEVMMPIDARLRDRMESIKKMASASHIKIEGEWSTRPPKFHIRKLTRIKRNNDEGEITFEVFEEDGKGNKKIYTKKQKVTLHDGAQIEREVSSDYRISYKVKELIKTGKPIQRELIKIDRRN